MKKKFKIILASVIVSLSLSNANAGLLNFAENHPILSAIGVGGVIYAQGTMHKARDLSYHLPKVESYFQTNPQDFNPIAKYVLNALAHPANKSDYDRYKRLAEVMELDNIPPYVPTSNNKPTILINPQQEQNLNDNVLENPIQNAPFSNIIITPQGEKIDTSTEFPIEQPKNWQEYLLLKQDSQELADNMEQAGMGTKPQGYAAHSSLFQPQIKGHKMLEIF